MNPKQGEAINEDQQIETIDPIMKMIGLSTEEEKITKDKTEEKEDPNEEGTTEKMTEWFKIIISILIAAHK